MKSRSGRTLRYLNICDRICLKICRRNLKPLMLGQTISSLTGSLQALPLAGNSESGLTSRWLPSNSSTGQLVTRIGQGQRRGHAGPAAHPLGSRHIQVHRGHRTFAGLAPHRPGPLHIRLASSTSTRPAAHLMLPCRARSTSTSLCRTRARSVSVRVESVTTPSG